MLEIGTGNRPLKMNHPSGERIGKDGMTLTEERSELTPWAEEAAPLIAGTDIIDMARQDRAIYTNPQVIAVDQDRLGVQAAVVSDSGSQWVLDKPLSGATTSAICGRTSTASSPARSTLAPSQRTGR